MTTEQGASAIFVPEPQARIGEAKGAQHEFSALHGVVLDRHARDPHGRVARAPDDQSAEPETQPEPEPQPENAAEIELAGKSELGLLAD